MLVISCHADTGFEHHALQRRGDEVLGHLDNFAGVYGVMKAYFSGRIAGTHTRIELTYGEETDMEGAQEVAATLGEKDTVVIVDVTGTATTKELVIEKCGHPAMQAYARAALKGLAFDLYADCPDPVSNCDETDVYCRVTPYTFFLGVPCTGGDYNEGQVACRNASIEALAEAVCRLSEQYPDFCRRNGMAVE